MPAAAAAVTCRLKWAGRRLGGVINALASRTKAAAVAAAAAALVLRAACWSSGTLSTPSALDAEQVGPEAIVVNPNSQHLGRQKGQR